MFNRLTVALVLLFAGLGLHPANAAQKKTKPKTATKPASTKRAPKKKAATRPARAKTQSLPTPERYREIQEALAAKGYLPPDEATGQWNDASVDALRRFQADQKIESTGRINSLSLIALGLGPRHETLQTGNAVPSVPPVQQP
jgi:peptidoglycan hydrolase-like protein with peptidoglycan-binding domain